MLCCFVIVQTCIGQCLILWPGDTDYENSPGIEPEQPVKIARAGRPVKSRSVIGLKVERQ